MPSLSGGMPSVDYDLCLKFESPETEQGLPVMRGQFCSLDMPGILPPWEKYRKNPINESIFTKIEQNKKENLRKQNKSLAIGRMNNDEITMQIMNDLIHDFDWGKDFFKLPTGLCLPNTCPAKDIERAINKGLFNKLNLVYFKSLTEFSYLSDNSIPGCFEPGLRLCGKTTQNKWLSMDFNVTIHLIPTF